MSDFLKDVWPVWKSDQPIWVLRQIGAKYDSEKVDSYFSESPKYSQPSWSKKSKTLCHLHTPDWLCKSEANERQMQQMQRADLQCTLSKVLLCLHPRSAFSWVLIEYCQFLCENLFQRTFSVQKWIQHTRKPFSSVRTFSLQTKLLLCV